MAGKILVLGATGNVGRPLVAELLANGREFSIRLWREKQGTL
jgi:uncharacterized protein YbjT (DUF2867 family)